MKKFISLIALILSTTFFLSGCTPRIMVIPDTDSIGETKTFTKDGITLLLTDKFVEKQSEVGFDAYYVSNFCGVVVLKEEFTLEEGLAERSLEDYVANLIENNGHKGIKPQHQDDLWYYVNDSGDTKVYSFSYKGSDSFYIVQYICMASDVFALEDLFFLWAGAVEVE
ncbi:MAG: hypothetical protein E7283_05990 [Lachnospiraceae bacterium]|nr:hypothetical protein [Lachnospiraceae bacterium]